MLTLRTYQQQAINDFLEYNQNCPDEHSLIVIPTGGGKSIIMAHIINIIIAYPHTRVLLATHQKELIKQNYNELLENFGNNTLIDAGIYSAGLKQRDTQNQIIFGGIQSIYKKAWELGRFDVMIIDEAHLIPHNNEGMYRSFIEKMEQINPKIVILGLTATPFRLKGGILTEGKGALFDSICHDTPVDQLIRQGYLCNLISKNPSSKVDLSNVHKRAGEFIASEMEDAFLEDDLVLKAVQEIKELTVDRKKILVFTAGIEHCEEVTKTMNSFNMNARFIHSKQSDEINQKNMDDFKNGLFNYLVNVNVLTTGYNNKAIDCICLLRSTCSPGLYIQMCGRGLRLHPDKENCLILDFGRNIERHGPINKIKVVTQNGKREISTDPQKECPECHILMPLAARECPECGYEYEFTEGPKHEETASEAEIISTWKRPETIEIEKVEYSRHEKEDSPDSLRVDYYVNDFFSYKKWVPVENPRGQRYARSWLEKVTDRQIDTVEEALMYCHEFKKPSKIIVDFNDKWPEIVGYIFEEEEPENFKRKLTEEEQSQVEALIF